ncbi:phage tail spike protein [Enterococcus sp. BWR-S5]|uniref:phage tail spike protein n=1 Tax=Enterococcus sp. BWR-S5 TaxID=2787714 RepID=UPI001924E2AF|nr:phage tail spike protein [Enterococcus sp. BWR-S5]MBL1226611.1 peptidoglycan DD-metalloendopeptidase family protein [Enterococcus sp. BWR-S5]
MIPILYEPKESSFNHNGLGKLADCISCYVDEERNGQNEVILTFPITTKKSEFLQENGYQIKAKANDLDEANVYVIYKHDQDMSTGILTVRGISRAVSKLKGRSIKRLTIESKNGAQAMHMVRAAMDRDTDIEFYSDVATISSTEFEITNPLNCIGGSQGSLLQNWGGEIKHEPFKISLLKNRGRENVTTIRYGKNLAGLSIETDFDSLLTRIFPYADLQNSEGETERIWGTQVDSQYINNYDDIRTDLIQFTEEQGVTDLATLNKVASKYFTSLNPGIDLPKCTIKANISQIQESGRTEKFKDLRKIGLCDTVTVYYKRFDIKITAKVNKIRYNSLLEQVEEFSAGSEQYTFFQAQNNQITETLKQIPSKQYASSFIEVVTQIISGNDGGNVVWWPKNRPTDLFFIDTDDLETAKRVLRINKSGIGFSSNGWKPENFDTAWTMDGKFVADYIQLGTLMGILIKGCEFQTISDRAMIRIKDGRIDFINKEDGGTFGTITPAFQSGTDGLMIGIDEGDFLSIGMNPSSSASSPPIIEIPKESTHSKPILNLRGEINITGKLTVNGNNVTGGGSGGGVIPPELTTEQEKNAWQIWQFFKAKGWTEEAIAGMLGNMQSESGIMPDIDEISGGGGYGLVQWTPKSKLVNWCNEKGLDYRTLDAQCQRIQWEVENNVQWFANPQRPDLTDISFVQFTKLTDVKLAADYFIAFYEHPADPFQPIRQTQAQYWYDKLKNLSSGTDGWQNPVRSAYTVTQEWDDPDYWSGGAVGIHGGIDLASAGGAKVPIFAAYAGTVITRTTDSVGGNYIVIDHGNSYWSYYGHLDSFNVSQGQTVTNADQIGIMGSTGGSTGVHLHFEVWKGSQWNRINPRDVISF